MNSTEQPLVVPAWCDPDRRLVRWSWDGTWVGVLRIDNDFLTYFTDEAVAISALLSEATIEWRGKSSLTTPRFDLHIPGHSYRFYLGRPGNNAPAFDPRLVEQIAEKASDAGNAAQLLSYAGVVPDVIGSLGQVTGLVGDLVRLPGAIADHWSALRNAAALRERLAALDDPVTPNTRNNLGRGGEVDATRTRQPTCKALSGRDGSRVSRADRLPRLRDHSFK